MALKWVLNALFSLIAPPCKNPAHALHTTVHNVYILVCGTTEKTDRV